MCINLHLPTTGGPCKFKAYEFCHTLGAWVLILPAITPCVKEGLAM